MNKAINEWNLGIDDPSRDVYFSSTKKYREKVNDPTSIPNQLVSVQGMSAEALEEYVHPYLPPEILEAAKARALELQ